MSTLVLIFKQGFLLCLYGASLMPKDLFVLNIVIKA